MKKMFKSFLKENINDVKKILVKKFVDKSKGFYDEFEKETEDEINSIYKFISDGCGGYCGVGKNGCVELGYSIVKDKSKIKEFDECYRKIKIGGKECYIILYNF